MTSGPERLLTVGVGDIHGRFHRVQEWLARLEDALGRPADLVLSVGDVEAFTRAEDHQRKATKRSMPAEFAEYLAGAATLRRPMYFIGGNNEDFATLHPMPEGGEVGAGLRYLGRAGVRELGGLKVAYLSGIYAPRYYEAPLAEPRTAETSKHAGYFRAPEVARLEGASGVRLMLLHEWPRGLVHRPRGRPGPPLRAYRFPWIGNQVARELVERIRPGWLWAGHSHIPFATTLAHPDETVTRVVCMDQATRPEGAVFWLEWEGGEPARGGWGITGEVAWRAGEAWGPERTPPV